MREGRGEHYDQPDYASQLNVAPFTLMPLPRLAVPLLIVYGPELKTVESARVLVPATTSRVVTVLLIVIVLLDPVSAVPCVQLVPFPAVTGVLASSVKHIIVGVPLELVHVTEMGELELPEVGVQEGAFELPPPLIVNAPTVRELGSVAPEAVQLRPAIV